MSSRKVLQKFSRLYNLTSSPGHFHVDINGTESENGSVYYILIVDDHARYIFEDPLIRKSDASDVIIEYHNFF